MVRVRERTKLTPSPDCQDAQVTSYKIGGFTPTVKRHYVVVAWRYGTHVRAEDSDVGNIDATEHFCQPHVFTLFCHRARRRYTALSRGFASNGAVLSPVDGMSTVTINRVSSQTLSKLTNVSSLKNLQEHTVSTRHTVSLHNLCRTVTIVR